MTWWHACLWGMLGAGLIEAKQMWHLYHLTNSFPWTRNGVAQVKPYLTAVGVRFFMAAGICGTYAAANQVGGSLAAVTLGITAPLIIQQIADSPQPTTARASATHEVPPKEQQIGSQQPPPPPTADHGSRDGR